ncbi:MAG TPA: CsgG/HfaB family protein [Gemmatimonadales bacterium]|nr:CsgG/HfaB family protein [Gemmatimonadales bacterium]
MGRILWPALLLAIFACAPRVSAPEVLPAAGGEADFRAAVQLGLGYEAVGRDEEALAAYQRAGTLPASRAERRSVEQRIIVLTRARLAADARRAIAAERELAATPAVPNTLAVLPWSYLGANPELKPLERGMAHLLVSDLAKVPRFTLLERDRVQALSDELALGAAGRLEPATAARSGRLLRAAEVLQGSLRETSAGAIRLDANIVSATTAEIQASGTASDRLTQLFAAEKALVLGLLDRLGVVLGPAEQRAIAERPTADLQAFLAFSQGLEAEDRGNFGRAAQLFQQAAARDPSFRAARDRAASDQRIGAASRMTPARLAQSIKPAPMAAARSFGLGGLRSAQLAAALQGVAPTLAGSLGPRARAALRARLAEALRQDDAGRMNTLGKLVGTIPRP